MSPDYTLAHGTHATPAQGRCAMEWVSYLAGEPHSDHPRCVSPVLRAFCTMLNDALEDGPRQRLRPYLARTIGTAGDGLDEARSWIALDWLVRSYAPAWLAAAQLHRAAERLATLPSVVDVCDLQAALAALAYARHEARGAWSAQLGSAKLFAWAPWTGGRAAAREAAWNSTGAPAWAAARVAVLQLQADRTGASAQEICGYVAALLVREQRHGTGAGRAGGRGAKLVALAHTTEQLQQSALGLLDRMLPAAPSLAMTDSVPQCSTAVSAQVAVLAQEPL